MKFQASHASKRSPKNKDEDTKKKKKCLKVGIQPFYIQPKKNVSFMVSEPSIGNQSDSNSQIGVPKFKTAQINGSVILSKLDQQQTKEQKFSISKESRRQKEDSQNYFAAQLVIWLFYFIGSINNLYTDIAPFLIIDCIGNGISLIFVVYTIYENRGLKSVSQILHIWSIILTATLYAYPYAVTSLSQSDKTFLKVVAILRTLRILFPLLYSGIEFQKFKKGCCNVYKLKNILLFSLSWLFFVGIFYQQFFTDSEGNRCRSVQIPVASEVLSSFDERLCGQRNCPSGTICTNPKRLGIKLSQEQQIISQAQFGLFTFDSSAQSMFSIFQIFTLNAWGKISSTYFDIYPGFIVVPFYLVSFIFFQFLIHLMILIFLEIKKKEQQLKIFKEKAQQIQPTVSIHLKYISIQDIKVDLKGTSSSAMVSTNDLAFKKSQKQSTQEKKFEKAQILTKWKMKILLYFLLLSFSYSHYVLASQFSLNPLHFNEDLYNRKIGIALAIFCILHFTILNFINFEFLEKQEDDDNDSSTSLQQKNQLKEKEKQGQSEKYVTDIIIKFEYFTFFTALADYLLRLIEGKYLLEEPSGLTFFFHFLLALRFYYVFLALIDLFNLTIIKKHLLLIVQNVISGFKFVLIYILIACFLGQISFIIDSQNYSKIENPIGFIFEINRILTFLINHSWQYLYNQYISHNGETQTPLYVKIVGGSCLILGSVIFMCYFISSLINKSFQYDLRETQSNEKVQTEKSEKEPKNAKIIEQSSPKKDLQDDQTKALKKQKSFYIFSYQNCFRQFALNIIKWKYYQQTIRFNFFILYLLIVIICFIVCDNNTYGIISSVLEGFVFLDILVTSLALRVFGQFSYSENSFFPIAHFIACFFIVVLSLTQSIILCRQIQLHFVPILQICRALIIFNYYESFQQTFASLTKLKTRISLHFLIIIPILLGYNLIALLLLSTQNQNQQFLQKLLESLKISLILFTQKGWNLQLFIGEDNLSTLFGQLSLSTLFIVWIVFSISFYCSLTGIIFSSLVKQKKEQQKQLRQKLSGSDILLQEMKIKERIKKMRPKFDYRIYGQGFFSKLCTTKYFNIIKKLCCICCFICFLAVNINLSTKERVALYSVHLFFLTIQLLLFVIESIAYKGNQKYFLRDLILNILAIPGTYIGFVNPVRYSNESYELKVILQLINALTVLRFVKIISYFSVFQKVCDFLYNKLQKTFHILALILMAAISMTGYLYQILARKEPLFNCLNYAFLGLFGGDFHQTIQTIIMRNQLQFTYQVHLLYFIINLSSQLFYSLQISFFIFQVSEIIKESIPFKNTDLSIYNFNKYFREKEFLNEWMKIDPRGKGFANFRIILNKSHLFLRHFSLSTLPYKSYSNRINTFKKLRLQIFQAQTTIQKEDEKNSQIHREYAITFYDFLFALNKYFFKEINSAKLIEENGIFVKNDQQQPISFLKINSGGYDISTYQMKNNQEIERNSEIWNKQIYSLSKQVIRQGLQEHPQIEGMNCLLKQTQLTSQRLYYGYRIKGRFLNFLKEIKIYNEIKRNQQGITSRSKK